MGGWIDGPESDRRRPVDTRGDDKTGGEAEKKRGTRRNWITI